MRGRLIWPDSGRFERLRALVRRAFQTGIHQQLHTAMNQASRMLRGWIYAAVVAATVAGCQTWNWRGAGYGENDERMPVNLRPPADERQFSGVNAKARDIERSLGVR